MTKVDFRAIVDKFLAAIPASEESGSRTIEHNRNVGGSADSAHVHGLAVDLILDTTVGLEAAMYMAKRLGFNGIEWDERNRHLHLDMHPNGRHWWVRIDRQGVSHTLSMALHEV